MVQRKRKMLELESEKLDIVLELHITPLKTGYCCNNIHTVLYA